MIYLSHLLVLLGLGPPLLEEVAVELAVLLLLRVDVDPRQAAATEELMGHNSIGNHSRFFCVFGDSLQRDTSPR